MKDKLIKIIEEMNTKAFTVEEKAEYLLEHSEIMGYEVLWTKLHNKVSNEYNFIKSREYKDVQFMTNFYKGYKEAFKLILTDMVNMEYDFVINKNY